MKSDELQTVGYEISIPKYHDSENHSHNNLFPLNKLRNVKHIIKVINQIPIEKSLKVVFDVPVHINEGLKTGRYIRNGGVIVQKEGKQVVHWLKEGKKITRFGNVVFQAVEIFSEIALNEKLKQIQEQLNEITDYVKARHHALIPSATENLRHALLTSDKHERKRLLSLAEKDLQTAKMEMKEFVKFRVEENHQKLLNFDKAWIHNDTEAKSIAHNINEILTLSQGISFCAQTQINIYEHLGDIAIAEDVRVQSLDYLSSVLQYVGFFLTTEEKYGDLDLVNIHLRSDNASSNIQGDLDQRVKKRGNAARKVINVGYLTTFWLKIFQLKMDESPIFNTEIRSQLNEGLKIEMVNYVDDLIQSAASDRQLSHTQAKVE